MDFAISFKIITIEIDLVCFWLFFIVTNKTGGIVNDEKLNVEREIITNKKKHRNSCMEGQSRSTLSLPSSLSAGCWAAS